MKIPIVRTCVIGALALLAVAGWTQASAATAGPSLTGEKLAALLRAARTVISGHQALINDASIGDKGLSGERIAGETIALYAQRVGSKPLDGDLSAREDKLLRAQLAAITEVVDEHQVDINKKGVGLKGFIPAVFARLVNERYLEKVGDLARIKVTAPLHLVRNRRARPDDWERDAIETILSSTEWTKGKTYSQELTFEGRPALRMLLPEYYSKSCLTCHGGPKGDLDITGYPKEGGKENDLAGAISIVIFE
ncbi:MAG: DUF3365 domain-containing protein [Rhizobiales bacterium]|nr:DUF3365 domain-containing protein [Hyphomicrobiales bacterium]